MNLCAKWKSFLVSLSTQPFTLERPLFHGSGSEQSFIPCSPSERLFGPEALKTWWWIKISTPFENIKFMVIVDWYPLCPGQPSWQPTFPWEAPKLLSGLGVVAVLHVFGVGTRTQALASLSCLAWPASHSFNWAWSLSRMSFRSDVDVKTNFTNMLWLCYFINLKNLMHVLWECTGLNIWQLCDLLTSLQFYTLKN